MAGMVGRVMMSVQAGIQSGWAAARRVYEEPGLSHRHQTWQNVNAAYTLLWAYYNNSLFDPSSVTFERGSTAWNFWGAYKQHYNLYRDIQLIYNPVRRLIEFYTAQIYPGVLSIDAKKLPDGVSLAIPFAADTRPEVLTAIGQIWQWSNWQSRKNVLIRWGGALGSVLAEIVDNPERRKVSITPIWPGFVSHIDLDDEGNVQEYHLQYMAQDEESGRTYTYRKEITKDAFRYFKDDEPFSYNGRPSVIPNPYTFVPAVWCKHIDTGGIQGSPAIAGSLGKIDHLNSLASHVDDQIHKVIGAPMILWTSSTPRNLFNTHKRGVSEDDPVPTADQESMLILKGSPDGHVDSLAGNLSLADASARIDSIMTEIEEDHPELKFYRELRSMSQVTGPAAQRLVGDVTSRISEAAANYDQASIRLFQMTLTIGGMRANSGAWGTLTRQQQKFLPFDLTSYERGDLDFEIIPRELLKPTRLEIGLENESMWRAVRDAHQANVPAEFVLRHAGWTEDKITPITNAQQQMIVAQASVARTQDTQALSGQGPQLPPGISQGQGR